MRRWMAAGLLMGLALAGCGKDEPAPADTTPATATSASAAVSAPAATAERAGPPAGVGAEPVTRTDQPALLTGGLVISSSTSCALTAVSLSQPESPLWKVEKLGEAAPTCGRPVLAGPNVVVGYESKTTGQGIEAGSTETGVAAVGPDGATVWQTPVKGVRGVVAASNSYVLAYSDIAGENAAHTSTVAVLDAASGKVLWQRADEKARIKAIDLDGDTVVLTDTVPPSDATVLGLDAATGKQRWSAPFRNLGAVGVAGGVVAVPHNAQLALTTSAGLVELRDVATGTVLDKVAKANQYLTCRADDKTVVCQANGGRPDGDGIFGFDLATHKKTWTISGELAGKNEVVLGAVVDGRVFVNTATGGALLDATTGRQLTANLPAAPFLVQGAYGLVHDESSGGDAVYLITA
jgi:outer membrane protein assembly factor BamB